MPFPPGILRTLATDVINEVTQLNNNWDVIDTKFSQLVQTGSVNPVTGAVTGVEWHGSTPTVSSLQAYDGTTWQAPQSETWGAWQTITLTAPYVAKAGDPPQLRVSNCKNVEMRGGIVNGSTPAPFPNSGYILINSGQFGTGYLPEMTAVTPIPGNLTTTAGQFVTGFSYVTVSGSPLKVAIYILLQGERSVNNFLKLDGTRYKAA